MQKSKVFNIFSATFLIIILVFLFLKYRRVSEKWNEDIKLLNGDIIKVNHLFSQRAMYGPLHFLIGGGGEKYRVSFDYNGVPYKWECLNVPIVIQFWNKVFYIIMLDRENLSNLQFKFYKYDDELKEISSNNFPKSIAIQNRWSISGKDIFRSKVPFKEFEIDPEDIFFRRSVLAKIWLRLEKGIDYNKTRYKEVDKYFLVDYKKKYIEPVWGKL